MTSGFSITAKDLDKRFNREWIFRKLSYQFIAGNIYAITGPNGSGKSTLLQVLSGFVPSSDGVLQYSYLNQPDIPVEEVYRHLAVAAPYMDLIDEFTLLEQLQFHFKLKKIRGGITIDNLIKIMYLDEARNKYIRNFSSGMKQRVKLGLAFYTEADLIILDEPGTNLDQQAFEWYVTELNKLPIDSLILIASNNPAEYPEKTKILAIQDFKRQK
jgi:ABC-type multidrug transport system ATPase subunit